MADYSDLGYVPAPAAAPPASNAYADLGYVPADQPQAHGPQQVQGAMSKFLGELWDQTGGSIGPTLRKYSGWDDLQSAMGQMKQGDYSGAGETLVKLAADPTHGMGSDTLETARDQIGRAGLALGKGDYGRAFGHLNAAIPLVGTVFAGGMNGIDKMAQGNHAEGAADVVANLGMLALPGAVEEAAGRATPAVRAQLTRVAPVVKAAVQAGSPDIAMGALKVGAGAAADAAGIPGHVATIMGAREGVPQIARGVAKGFKAGRQVIVDRGTPPPLPAEAPPVASSGPPPVPPYFAEGSTTEAGASAPGASQPPLAGRAVTSTIKYADLGYIPAAEPVANGGSRPTANQPQASDIPAQPGESSVPEPMVESGSPPAIEAAPVPVSDTNTVAETPQAAAPPEPQPTLLDEPAYERPDEPSQKPDYQAAARTVKGRGLARFLTNPPEGPAITAEEATRMTPEQWQMIAREAGLAAKAPPSPETVKVAIDHMREIESRRAQRTLGPSTEDSGAAPAATATLPADGEASPTDQPLEAPHPGTGSEGVSVSQSTAPGSESGASATQVHIPGEGRSIPASYRVRELADIQSSHNGLTFQPNPRYTLVNDRNYATSVNQGKVIEGSGGKFEPAFHVTDNPDAVNGPPIIDAKGNAVGGNGRTMQLQRVYAYNPKGAAAYRDLLTKKAGQFGIDPAEIAGMKQPVLVREIADEHLGQASRAITDLNKTGTAALTPAERAIADSRRVSSGTLDHIAGQLDAAGPDASLTKVLSGDGGPVIFQKLVGDGVLTKQETAAYISDGKLTPAAKTRISKLLLGRFFRDPAQLDTTPAPMVAKLERLAAPVAKLEGQGAWNLTPKLQEALDLLDEARAHGTRNLSEFLKQTGLLGETRYTEDGVTLAKALQRFTGRQLGQAVKDYAATAKYAAEHADAKAGLFGSEVKGEAPMSQEAFEAAFHPGKQSPPATTAVVAKPAKAKPGKSAAELLGDQLKRPD